ncbi:tRNA (N6-isopentenyl adenosine(37)-C2)-methylthiotransferase MiaB [Candidatus Sumerlaeota bacterium]|nr:tRNA (N6-isopentenyl adenosine(37)-C2)-methylthiotransferase MiaB [Candidatus Sumerlaeota bacterium]
MKPRAYHVVSYGCQMNAYDSEVMAGILEARGLERVADERRADVILVNTCIVRGSAEQRAMGRIMRLKALKNGRPDRILGVCGCLAQRDADALLDKAPHLDLVLGTRAIPHLSALIDRIEQGQGPIVCVEEDPDPYPESLRPVRRSALRALVPIMTGCDNWCSYCIVPAVRGRELSRAVETVLAEVRGLVSTGRREVTLVGQNVNSYRGVDADGRETDFAGLLERVDAIEGLGRIRYITSHPRDANPRHLDAVARLEKVCDHFHLPAQSGSNAVLERMNRGYTRERYLALIRSVRERLPDAAITTDLIVGFPGETDRDYEDTLDLMREVRFDSAFTFLYNVREGTRAAREFEDDVPFEVKRDRLARVIRLQEKTSLEKNRSLEGRDLEVLVEGPAKRAQKETGRGTMVGRTTGDKCVIFDGDPEDAGRLVSVRIVGGAAHTLFGRKTP